MCSTAPPVVGAESRSGGCATDEHAAASVTGGVFNVALGGGTLAPGTVGTLAAVFMTNPEVYLQVRVSGETLCPRTQVLSAAYSINGARASEGPLDLFVDGATGDDGNDGLTSSSAKQTIMGAVRAIPIVLNGDVTVHIEPGTYQEEVVLSGRQRNGLFTVLLQQNVPDPEVTAAGVLIQPPPQPCGTCTGIGILVTDEIVRLVGIQVDGFEFVDSDGDGIVASGSTNLTLANVVISNNDTGIFGTDGHFVELEASCTIVGNNVGIRASDHGSFEVNGPFTSCDNGAAAVAARNSWIRFEGSLVDCVFCPTDGAMSAELYSSITVDGACSGVPSCNATPEGLCP